MRPINMKTYIRKSRRKRKIKRWMSRLKKKVEKEKGENK